MQIIFSILLTSLSYSPILFAGKKIYQTKRAISLNQQEIAITEKDCKKKIQEACHVMGMLFIWGVNPQVKKNNDSGIKLLAQSCKKNYEPSCSEIANLYQGYGAEKYKFKADKSKAIFYLDRACKLAPKWNCGTLVDIFSDSDTAKEYGKKLDFKKAMNYRKMRCKAKMASVCGEVAEIYEEGREGFPKSKKLATKYYKEAVTALIANCNEDDNMACNHLGSIFRDGEYGQKVNLGKSIKYAKIGCKREDFDSCYDVGKAYFNGGPGLKKNKKHAIKYLKLSCDNGYRRACRMLEN